MHSCSTKTTFFIKIGLLKCKGHTQRCVSCLFGLIGFRTQELWRVTVGLRVEALRLTEPGVSFVSVTVGPRPTA